MAWPAIVFFDYLVTFSDEVNSIWSRKFSLATAIFFLNRYVSLSGYAVLLYFQFFTFKPSLVREVPAFP